MSFERRKVRVGRVVGDKMDKTVVVSVEWRTSHSLYRKAIRRRTRFKAHDAKNECRIGDLVRMVETRPASKTKRWRVAEILAREDIAELQPDEIAVDETVMTARGAATDDPAVAVAAAEVATTDEPAEAEEAAEEELAAEPAEAEEAAEEELAAEPAEAEEAVEEEPAAEPEEKPPDDTEEEPPAESDEEERTSGT